jgi:hypothetical protein
VDPQGGHCVLRDRGGQSQHSPGISFPYWSGVTVLTGSHEEYPWKIKHQCYNMVEEFMVITPRTEVYFCHQNQKIKKLWKF